MSARNLQVQDSQRLYPSNSSRSVSYTDEKVQLFENVENEQYASKELMSQSQLKNLYWSSFSLKKFCPNLRTRFKIVGVVLILAIIVMMSKGSFKNKNFIQGPESDQFSLQKLSKELREQSKMNFINSHVNHNHALPSVNTGSDIKNEDQKILQKVPESKSQQKKQAPKKPVQSKQPAKTAKPAIKPSQKPQKVPSPQLKKAKQAPINKK